MKWEFDLYFVGRSYRFQGAVQKVRAETDSGMVMFNVGGQEVWTHFTEMGSEVFPDRLTKAPALRKRRRLAA